VGSGIPRQQQEVAGTTAAAAAPRARLERHPTAARLDYEQ
jgi:hypothetical protein